MKVVDRLPAGHLPSCVVDPRGDAAVDDEVADLHVDAADHLRPEAEQAVADVRDTASEAASQVKDAAAAAKDDVAQQTSSAPNGIGDPSRPSS